MSVKIPKKNRIKIENIYIFLFFKFSYYVAQNLHILSSGSASLMDKLPGQSP